jgi:HEAT repeats
MSRITWFCSTPRRGRLSLMTIVVAALLAMPAFPQRGAAAVARPDRFAQSSASATEGDSYKEVQNQDQEKLDREQEARDREQEKREREQEAREREREREEEKRDREEEKRDREQERLDRLNELYDDGREDLDDDHYERAEARFHELAQMNGPQTDAALYWKAYAQNRLGKKDASLATIADLKKRFPQSRWQKDAAALEIEVRQSSGQPANPEAQKNDELRMLALQGLINSDPERAIPFLGKVLEGSGSPKEKSKALFVLAQSGRPEAREILGKIARGQSNPDMQRKAIQYLGLFGGSEARKTLAEVYASSNDPGIKRSILRSYMVAGDKEHLFEAAKGEKNDEVKREAIRQLGLVHGQNELQQLYRMDNSPEVRRELLKAFFLSGDSPKLLEVAQTDKDAELRREAVHNLGLIHSDDAGKALQTIYSRESDRNVKEEVLNALFIQGNAAAIVAIARNEKDAELKRVAVSKLSIMHSKEATDYLMEILQK